MSQSESQASQPESQVEKSQPSLALGSLEQLPLDSKSLVLSYRIAIRDFVNLSLGSNSDKQKEEPFSHHEMRLHFAAYRPCISRKPWRICFKSGQYRCGFARYSTGPLISPQCEEVNVHVKVGSSGHISLE